MVIPIRFPCTYKPGGGKYNMGQVLNSPIGDADITLYFGAVDENHHQENGGHAGLDIIRANNAVTLDTPVVLKLAGDISVINNDSIRGNYIDVAHGGGFYSTYLHLRELPNFTVGQHLTAETILGFIGMTGLTTGPHEHWGIYRIDPVTGALQYWNPLACMTLPTVNLPAEIVSYIAGGGMYIEEPTEIEGARVIKILLPEPSFPGPRHLP